MSIENTKINRNPVETRQQILNVAFYEIYKHGFKGASTNTIIEKMDLSRGAFFHHFPTKNELGYALIDEVLNRMIIERWIKPIEQYDNPLTGIVDNFARLINEHQDKHILHGCPLNNLVQEMSDRPEFQIRIKAIMQMWIKETQSILTQAKRTGYLAKHINTRQLAEFIVACQEAAYSMGKALNSRNAMLSIWRSLKDHLTMLNHTCAG